MTHHDPHAAGDAEREALATLIARFSADRDLLAAGVQRAEAAVRELATRLDAVAAHAAEAVPAHEIEALRLEMARVQAGADSLREDIARVRGELATPRDEVASSGAAPLMAAVDEVRTELRRLGAEIAEQASLRAERAVTGVVESSAEAQRSLAASLAETRAQLTSALEDVRRVAVASGERAAQALAQAADLDRGGGAVDALRATLGQLRDETLRRIEETEARLDVRLDSIVAGVEAETRAVRDGLWDRVSGAEQRLQAAETLLTGIRVEVLQTAARALEGVVAVQGEVDGFQQELDATGERLAALERQRAARSGLGGVVEYVRDELVAAVMMVVSIGAVLGRLTLSLVR